MSLNMWKNRCKCLHGHTTTEQTMINQQKLMRKIKWCYRNKNNIPEQQQHIFSIDMETLCKSKSPFYLQSWIKTFEAFQQHARRECGWTSEDEKMQDSQSDYTCDTRDLDEYLLDINDGMDMDNSMADAGISRSKMEEGKQIAKDQLEDGGAVEGDGGRVKGGQGKHGLVASPIKEKKTWHPEQGHK